MKRGFNSARYIHAQKKEILKRIKKSNRLYLEFGGKLLSDDHAARVLPGYNKKTKINLLKEFVNPQIIYCISAKHIESNKVLGKNELTYRQQALEDLSQIRRIDHAQKIVVITRYSNQAKAKDFAHKLEGKGKEVYFHKEIKDYAKDIKETIKGYQNQPFIPIKSNLVIITGPASGSGKMAVAISQIHHEKENKKRASYAKFETFPIHNLPLSHPINLAYEAATADLQDKNKVDPFHLKYYKKNSINYNRDIENFKVLQEITKNKFPFGYKSPTDMGINEAKKGITNDLICQRAAIKEIKRRYKFYSKEYKKGRETIKTINRMHEIIKKIK